MVIRGSALGNVNRNILEILNEEKQVKHTDLLNMCRSRIGKKISRHTFNRSIQYLLFMGHIKKDSPGGRGDPKIYSLDSGPYLNDNYLNANRERLLNLIESDPERYNACHFQYIDTALYVLNHSLIRVLNLCSLAKTTNEANDIFESYIKAQMIPFAKEILKLTKPPLHIENSVYIDLLTVYDPLNHCRWLEGNGYNAGYPPESWSKEKREDMDKRMLEWLDKMDEEEKKYLKKLNEIEETCH